MNKILTEKLDELKIKYFTKKIDVKGKDFIFIYTTVPNNEDTDKTSKSCDDKEIEIIVWFMDKKQTPFLCFYVSDVFSVPSNKRRQVKNFLLNHNSINAMGSFSLRTRNRSVEFNFGVVLTYHESEQPIEIANLQTYLDLVKTVINSVTGELKKITDESYEE